MFKNYRIKNMILFLIMTNHIQSSVVHYHYHFSSNQSSNITQSSFDHQKERRMLDMEKRRNQLEHKLNAKFDQILRMNGQKRRLTEIGNWNPSQVVVVMDIGSYSTKVGYAGEDAPIYTERTAVIKKSDGSLVCGDEALKFSGYVNPISHGIIVNFDAWEQLFRCICNKLNIETTNNAFLLTETPLNPKANREKVIQILFETFKVGYFYVAIDSVLGLYETGRTTGIVLKIGGGVSHSVPVYEGYALPHSIIRLDLAGNDLDDYMKKLEAQKGINMTIQEAREIKEKVCYVAQDYEREILNNIQKDVTLKNGRTYVVDENSFKVPEALFQPLFVGMESAGIHETTYNSIMKCDVDIRKDLYFNTVVTGGGSMFSGIANRLQNEIAALAPPTMKIKVLALIEREFQDWIGGSVLGSLSTFQQMWITQQEYKDNGPSIVHRKCF